MPSLTLGALVLDLDLYHDDLDDTWAVEAAQVISEQLRDHPRAAGGGARPRRGLGKQT